MSGKQFDIWGLPIEDEKGPTEAEASAPDTVAPDTVAPDAVAPDAVASDTVASDTVASDTVALSTAAADIVAADTLAAAASAADTLAAAASAADTLAVATSAAGAAAADAAASETVAPADVAETPIINATEPTVEEDVLAAAPAVAPVSEDSAPVVDEPVLAAAPAVAPVPEVIEAPEAPVAEVHAPDAVLLPPLEEDAGEAPATESAPSEVQPDEPPSLRVETVTIAPIIGAPTTGAPTIDAPTTGAPTTGAPTSDDSPPAKPEKAWIPPGRRKQFEAEVADELSTAEAAPKPASVGEAITGASAVGATKPLQASSPSPVNPEPAHPATTTTSGAYAGSYSSYAPASAPSSQPTPPLALPPAATPAVTPAVTTARYPAVPPAASPQTDDFWGVPPTAEVAQAAPKPAAHTPASTQSPSASARPASAATNRSTSMSMPISNPLTATAVAAAALPPVGGLVPQTYLPPTSRPSALPSATRSAPRVQSEGRIEVVNPEGWKREFPLRRSILYVGSAAGSDILLPVAGIAPRHLQFVPSASNRVGYRMINLGGAPVTLRGASAAEPKEVAARASAELADGDRLEFGGYAIVFYSGEMSSQLIQVRLEVPNPRVELDKPLDGALYIRNGGDRAGVQFVVEVQGIDSRYVQIESGPVLFPDVEKRVAFRIAHPRAAQPAAGDQPINFVVTAPEGYPGETAVASQVVSIAPFFAHKVRLIAIEPELSGYTLSSG